MEKVWLNQEELIEAFNDYMPKRPVYPPLVEDDDDYRVCNSATASEDEDEAEVTVRRMRLFFRIKMKSNMSNKCKLAYENNPSIKTPDAYLQDNVKKPIEALLKKLVNLKKKPKDPVLWLAFQLINLNTCEPNLITTQDHLQKPTGDMLDFNIESEIRLEDFFDLKEPETYMYQPTTPACIEVKIGEKRKLQAP